MVWYPFFQWINLYAVANQIQWNWPDTRGEDHFIIMLGGILKDDSHEDAW